MNRISRTKLACVAWAGYLGLGLAGLSFGQSADQTPFNLLSLSNVQITNVRQQIPVMSLNPIPIGGFTPQVVFGLTNEQADPDNFDLNAATSSIPGGTRIPNTSPPTYFVATYDTGSQSHLISYADLATVNLAAAGREGAGTAEVSGVGTEITDVTDALGIYATGFQNASFSSGAISINLSTLKGQTNTSILTARSGSVLPNVIGTPMTYMYQTVINNSQTVRLNTGTATYRSPEVEFRDHGTGLSGYSKLSLSVDSYNGTDPPYYFGFNLNNPGDDPDIPTFWASLFANVTTVHNGGTINSSFLYDTGAQISAISTDTANSMGIFTKGANKTPEDFTVHLDGAGGQGTTALGYYINDLHFTTDTGSIDFNHVPVIVFDLPDPRSPFATLPGVLGTNLFTNRDLVVNLGGTQTGLYIGPELTPQWNNAAGGNWGEDLKWIMGVPDDVDAPANFLNAISSPQTIVVDGPGYKVGSIKFDSPQSYTIDGPGRLTVQNSSGLGSITIASGTHTINAPMTFTNDVNITTIPAGAKLTIGGDVDATGVTITKAGAGVLEMKNIRAGALAVSAGAVKVTANGTSSGTSRLGGLSISTGAQLDLANNHLVIDYTTLGTLSDDIRAHLASGRLTSSAADTLHRLGYANNADLHKTSYAGQSVTDNTMLVGYTYAGDANLDGMVDVRDLMLLALHWKIAGYWDAGDFNYDGAVNAADLGLLARDWQQGVGNPLGGAGLSQALSALGLPDIPVPEPTEALILLAFIIASGSSRLRRRPHRL